MKLKVELLDAGISKFVIVNGSDEERCLEEARKEYPRGVDSNFIVDWEVIKE